MGKTTGIDCAAEVAIALAKSFAKATGDVTLEPGLYNVDEVISFHVIGTVKRSPDTEYSPSVEIPLVDVLALALERAGLDRRDAKRAVELGVADYLDSRVLKNHDRIRDVEDAVVAAKEQLKVGQPLKARTGATTVNVNLEIVRPMELAEVG